MVRSGRGPACFLAPGGPRGVDDPQLIDYGESSGQFLVPASHGQLDFRVGGQIPERSQRGERHDQVAYAVESKSPDPSPGRGRCESSIRGSEAQWDGGSPQEEVQEREGPAFLGVVDTRPAQLTTSRCQFP